MHPDLWLPYAIAVVIGVFVVQEIRIRYREERMAKEIKARLEAVDQHFLNEVYAAAWRGEMDAKFERSEEGKR